MNQEQKPLEGIEIRLGSSADLWSLHWLRSLAGWNQSLGLWELFLKAPSSRVFVACWGGMILGSATLWYYGKDLAWIGMVIVHPSYRRRGIAGMLLQACQNCAREEGIGRLGLDATPSGRPLYRDLDFVEGERLDRWFWPPSRQAVVKGCDEGRFELCWDASHFLEVLEEDVDSLCFGAERKELLGPLIRDSYHSLVVRGEKSVVLGYGMLRHGATHAYLGPVVAVQESAGRRVVSELLIKAGRDGVYWDIPAKNRPACALAETFGFQQQRPLYRMWYTQAVDAPTANQIWAIVDPALG